MLRTEPLKLSKTGLQGFVGQRIAVAQMVLLTHPQHLAHLLVLADGALALDLPGFHLAEQPALWTISNATGSAVLT